jgi:hypothetical protein
MVRHYKDKECAVCGASYLPSGNYQKICSTKCRKERCKHSRQENKEKIAERNKRYYQENKEKVARRNKRYYLENKEKVAKANKRWHQENKEKMDEYRKQYYQENKEKVAEVRKQWRQKNKEKIAERNKRYYQENKEKIAEGNKHYYEENKEKVSEVNNRWYQKNKEKMDEYRKQYYQENKEKIGLRVKQYHKDAKTKGTVGVYSILNKSTDRKYIGESVFVERRWRKHLWMLKSEESHPNPLLQKDYDKYGVNAFEFSVIREVNKEDFQAEEDLKEYLRTEEAKIILKEAEEGSILYNLALNPLYVVAVLKERIRREEQS